jgi:hypothetical protein
LDHPAAFGRDRTRRLWWQRGDARLAALPLLPVTPDTGPLQLVYLTKREIARHKTRREIDLLLPVEGVEQSSPEKGPGETVAGARNLPASIIGG